MSGRSDGYEVVAEGLRDSSEAPRGPHTHYRCLRCGGLVPSQPADNVGCGCGNVFVDVDAHRLAVRDLACLQVVRVARPSG